MAKGYQEHRERQEAISALGKTLARRAKFRCEWCGDTTDLRPWDHRPEREPVEENLALLCGRCREWAGGKPAAPVEVRAIRDALWSDVPAIAEGAARVLARCREPWAREAIEDSLLDDAVKQELLG